jgi:hypothetical protein
MQRNKRLLKVRKARKRKRQKALLREQKKKGQAASQESGDGLLDVVQCTAKLKSGKRCSRSAEKKVRGKWVCWQHAKKKRKATKQA